MARPKKTDAEKLAELLGIEAPKGNPHETPEDVSRQAEAALQYAETPKSFIRKNCKSCGRTFAHTRGAIAYCSNACRARSLEQIGISWDWNKPTEVRWELYEGGEPLIVPPEALALIDQVSDTQDDLKCPVYNHMRDQPEHGAWCWGDTEVPEGVELIPYTDKPEPEPEPEPDKSIPGLNPTLDVLDILVELGLE